MRVFERCVSHCKDVIVFKRKPNALKWSVLRIWIMLEWKFKKCSCRAERTVKGLVLEREGIYSTLPTLIFYMNTLVCILFFFFFFSFRYSKHRFKCFCNLSPNHRKGSNCDYCIIWKITHTFLHTHAKHAFSSILFFFVLICCECCTTASKCRKKQGGCF